MADTLICSVELNKEKGQGIIVKVQNASGQITQTIQMDGTKVTVTVKGAQSTSTITQDSESLELKVVGPAETNVNISELSKAILTASRSVKPQTLAASSRRSESGGTSCWNGS